MDGAAVTGEGAGGVAGAARDVGVPAERVGGLELETVGARFSTAFYAAEYPDVRVGPADLLEHFCAVGWREGRNPNPFFDTTSYLADHADVVRAGANPYLHYLTCGDREGRAVHPSVTPSVRTRLLLGYPIADWVERLRPYVDAAFYDAQLDGPLPAAIDRAAHFAFRGWRENLSPNPELSIARLLERHPRCAALLVNPLIVHLEAESGRHRPRRIFKVRTRRPAEEAAPVAIAGAAGRVPAAGPVAATLPDADAAARSDADDIVRVLAAAMTDGFYPARYPDVAAAGVEPALHYAHTGWREGRDPREDFDTRYYLAANDDVRRAGINPFWHYLVAGRVEGRLPQRPGGYRRRIVDAAREPARRTEDYAPAAEAAITPARLAARLRQRFGEAAGLALAISHDCYVRVVGGTQILIADEERRFNAAGWAYLHLSPVAAQMRLAEDDPALPVRVVLDGEVLGALAARDLGRVLAASRRHLAGEAHLVVHCLLGMSAAAVCAVADAIGAARRFFWVHDYSSLCEGFNLLRNDVAFCGAPPAASMACRICVYGGERRRHLERIADIFRHCRFEVLAPSEAALELWRASTDLPHVAALVHPHWRAIEAPRPRRRAPPAPATAPAIAFVGYPSPHKGWLAFADLAGRRTLRAHHRFFVFSAEDRPEFRGKTFVRLAVRPADRYATVRALKRRRIDAVAILSPWPETFSFVAFEAMAAGCLVLCLRDGGNVARAVAATGRGRVFEDADALAAFLADPATPDWIRATRAGLAELTIEDVGTTATVAGVLAARDVRAEAADEARPRRGEPARDAEPAEGLETR